MTKVQRLSYEFDLDEARDAAEHVTENAPDELGVAFSDAVEAIEKGNADRVSIVFTVRAAIRPETPSDRKINAVCMCQFRRTEDSSLEWGTAHLTAAGLYDAVCIIDREGNRLEDVYHFNLAPDHGAFSISDDL